MLRFLILFLIIIFPLKVFAMPDAENFEENKFRLACALTSLAAYGNDESFLMRAMLNSRGWKIEGIQNKNSRADAKAYLISKTENNHTTKILVITGTEDLKDVEVDFRFGRVPLKNTETADDIENKIFVHRGFRDYTDNVLSGGVAEYLIDDLKKNPNETLYLTGHSLGGAVATLVAIRLCDMGIDTNRMKVITFGAPAVGNKKLAQAYENKIDLVRVEMNGDPIKKSLAVLGYVHFGESLKYKKIEVDNLSPHSIAIYLDNAIRNYYDTGGFNEVPKVDSKYKNKIPVYVAPIKIVDKSFKKDDEKYIEAIVRDHFLASFEHVTFAEKIFMTVDEADNFSFSVQGYINEAKKFGCKFIIVQMLRSEVMKESERRTQRIILEEIIYDLKGNPLTMQNTGMTTEKLSILEAVQASEEYLQDDRRKIF